MVISLSSRVPLPRQLVADALCAPLLLSTREDEGAAFLTSALYQSIVCENETRREEEESTAETTTTTGGRNS